MVKKIPAADHASDNTIFFHSFFLRQKKKMLRRKNFKTAIESLNGKKTPPLCIQKHYRTIFVKTRYGRFKFFNAVRTKNYPPLRSEFKRLASVFFGFRAIQSVFFSLLFTRSYNEFNKSNCFFILFFLSKNGVRYYRAIVKMLILYIHTYYPYASRSISSSSSYRLYYILCASRTGIISL